MIEKNEVDSWPCPCGCGKEFPRHSGVIHCRDDSHALYRASLMQETEGEPHLWLLIGTGPWFADDLRGCWLVMHSWLADDGTVSASIVDPDESPFCDQDVFEERLLTREEVFDRPHAPDWAFRCHDLLLDNHPEVTTFMVGA